MPPSQPPSDIQVFVRWKEQTIFAGEDVECVITFKNVASVEPDSSSLLTNRAREAGAIPKNLLHQSVRSARHGGSPMINGGNGGTAGNGNGRFTPHKTLRPSTSGSSVTRRPTPLSLQQSLSDQGSPRLQQQQQYPPPAPRSRPGSRPSLAHSQHSYSFPSTLEEDVNGLHVSRPSTGIANTSNGNVNGNGNKTGHRHQKSLSIISFDSDRGSTGTPLQHPARTHSRSYSVQAVPPRRMSSGGLHGDTGYPSPRSSYRTPSAASNPNPSISNTASPRLPNRPQSQHKSLPTSLSSTPSSRPKPFLVTDFKFPSTLSPVEASGDSPTDIHDSRPPFTPRSNEGDPTYAPSIPSIASPTGSTNPNSNALPPTRPRSRAPSVLDSNASTSRLAPLTRILSETTGINIGSGSNTPSSTGGNINNFNINGPGGSGITESARSSADFYSVSNLSSETLESEYTQYTTNRNNLHSSNASVSGGMHSRGPSMSTPMIGDMPRRAATVHSPMRRTQKTQTLLMGYAQISGTFSVDGSLVDQSQFEKVKRSGVMGTTQANGEPRPSQEKKSGFWGNFGLNKLEGSLSGFLGSGELDGLREMRGVTSSSSIPLLSTPQSLLFVDLQLHPGEEKSFSFSFSLPRGLPASHKGKAIKISYNLIIGTQRPSQGKEMMHKMNKISIPFRVLSGVDVDGEILGHDLTRPYVLLRDEAKVQKIENKEQPPPRPSQQVIGDRTWTGTSDFLNYVDSLLRAKSAEQGENSFAATSPSSLSRSTSSQTLRSASQSEFHPLHYTCKTAIDRAIMNSNTVGGIDHRKSRNRFEITRSGRRIAVIILNRPAHRLGETITATIDFTGAALPCYSLYATLESSEKVNPTIALRSSTSISRATRRVYSSCSENTLFAQRVSFTPSIPVSATPTLLTSSISLAWELRFEFVTSGVHDEFDVGPTGVDLLEAVEQDDRHTILASLEYLPCDSFEIAIPLTVYGGSTREPTTEEVRGYPI